MTANDCQAKRGKNGKVLRHFWTSYEKETFKNLVTNIGLSLIALTDSSGVIHLFRFIASSFLQTFLLFNSSICCKLTTIGYDR